MRIYSLLT